MAVAIESENGSRSGWDDYSGCPESFQVERVATLDGPHTDAEKSSFGLSNFYCYKI